MIAFFDLKQLDDLYICLIRADGIHRAVDKDLSFGEHYGVVMKEMRLLARSVFVLDENNHVVYKELVQEGTDFPNFEAALEAYRNI